MGGWFLKLMGGISGNIAEVDVDHNALVALSKTPASVGPIISSASIDDGTVTGVVETRSIDVDEDFKTRIGSESLLDVEIFNYANQNTGKHTYVSTTTTFVWSTTGLTSNGAGGVASGSGANVGSYAYFPLYGAQTLYCEMQASFSQQPTSNTFIDFGLFQRGTTPAFAPLDGIYFRQTSAGMFGVINNNGTETTVGPFTWTYNNNQKYQFILQISERRVYFWLDNVLMGAIDTPVGQGRPCMSASLPFSWRHAIVGGAAGVALQMNMNSYTVSLFGEVPADRLSIIGNRTLGSYQGLSGGTMGSLATYPNSANPTAAVPSNTALTANLLAGLGGQVWETGTLALNTDGILMDFVVPAGTVNVQGRRLVIRGISLRSYIQTVLAGGPLVAQWCLCFGHTATSLATAEGIAAKAPRRIALPDFTQVVTAAQAVSTLVSQPGMAMTFDSPIFVNPGEHVALVKKHIGTVLTAGVFGHTISFDYGWE